MTNQKRLLRTANLELARTISSATRYNTKATKYYESKVLNNQSSIDTAAKADYCEFAFRVIKTPLKCSILRVESDVQVAH